MGKTRGYFARLSNDLIKSSKQSVDKKLLLTMIYLDRRRSLEDICGLSLYGLATAFGYAASKNSRSSLLSFKNQIISLASNGMIEMLSPIEKLKGDTCFDIKILDAFDSVDHFTILTAKEIDTLISSKSSIEKDNLFAIYLYMKSFMFPHPLDNEGNLFKDAKDKPASFRGTIDSIVLNTGTSIATVNSCIEEIVKLKLFKRHETGSYPTIENGKQVERNAPNIYVLNDEDADREIQWSIEKLKTIFKVDSFGKFKRKRKKSAVKSRRGCNALKPVPIENCVGIDSGEEVPEAEKQQYLESKLADVEITEADLFNDVDTEPAVSEDSANQLPIIDINSIIEDLFDDAG